MATGTTPGGGKATAPATHINTKAPPTASGGGMTKEAAARIQSAADKGTGDAAFKATAQKAAAKNEAAATNKAAGPGQ